MSCTYIILVIFSGNSNIHIKNNIFLHKLSNFESSQA